MQPANSVVVEASDEARQSGSVLRIFDKTDRHFPREAKPICVLRVFPLETELSSEIEEAAARTSEVQDYPRQMEAARRIMGRDRNHPGKPKTPVFAAVQRGGDVRARVLPSVTADNLRKALVECADPSSRLVTDDLNLYWKAGKPFARHDRVKHSMGEYVNKADPSLHSNTIESFFARLKRKLHGTHHAVSKEHLHRYVSEAAFLYNTRGMTDGDRVLALLHKTDGKRLVYRSETKIA